MSTSPLAVDGRLRATAARSPGAVAFAWHDQSLTYGELDAQVDAAAGGFQHLGVRPGDRVALLLGNIPAFVAAWFGVLRAGGVAVPLTVGLAVDEVVHALNDSGATVLVVAAVAADDLVDIATELDVTVVVAGADQAPAGASRWRDLLAGGHDLDEVDRGGDDLAAILYTSGTTGRPKGAMLTHANLVSNQDQSLAGRFQVTSDDVVLLVLPLSHVYALNVGMGTSVHVGATMVLHERFDPTTTLDLVAEHGITIVLGAPPMYVAWNQTPGVEDRDLGSLRLCVSGAAPLAREVIERFRALTGRTIEEGYGLTEAGPSVTSNAMAPEARPGTVGMPLPDVELRLLADGVPVAPGEVGEVCVRGPNVFVGYWNDPDATAAALDDGWLHTGDIGVVDPDDYLRLVDREDDTIIVSGFNVYPSEVERVLLRHDAVTACAVAGVPHPYTGQAVRAWVVADGEVTEDELVAFCESFLARYKCPETISLVPVLPATPSGKIRRVALREADS